LDKNQAINVYNSCIFLGLVDAEGNDLNPWDKSASYRLLLKRKHGPKTKLSVKGMSLPMYAPESYLLTIHYCDICIGKTSFKKLFDMITNSRVNQ
jgi:hypothetical protein